MKPQFRFEDGQLWWRDYRSSLAEMKRVRVLIADPECQWTSETTSTAELTSQIDAALAAMETDNA